MQAHPHHIWHMIYRNSIVKPYSMTLMDHNAQTLPPEFCDHHNSLTEGAAPLKVKPYHYRMSIHII